MSGHDFHGYPKQKVRCPICRGLVMRAYRPADERELGMPAFGRCARDGGAYVPAVKLKRMASR